LDAGALLLLTGAVRKSARAASDGDAGAQRACSLAVGAVVAVLQSCDEAFAARAAAASGCELADAVAEALEAHGGKSDVFASYACCALIWLLRLGAPPGNDTSAAATGRGAALALEHASLQQAHPHLRELVALTSELFSTQTAWPSRVAASAAFYASGGLEALLKVADTRSDDDEPHSHLLKALTQALVCLGHGHTVRLSDDLDVERVYRLYAHALQDAELPLPNQQYYTLAISELVEHDDLESAHLASSGMLDAAVLCMQRDLAGAEANELRHTCAKLIYIAAVSGAVPVDVDSALRALVRQATTSSGSEERIAGGMALHRLCACPDVVNIVIKMGVPAALAEAAQAACNAAPEECELALSAVLAFAGQGGDSYPESESVLWALVRAGVAKTALRALQLHTSSAAVALHACALLSLLSDGECAGVTMRAIQDAHGWRLLVAALRQHPDEACLPVFFCTSKVLWFAAAHPEGRSAAVAAGALPAVTAAMRAHGDNLDVQHRGLMVLHKLGSVEDPDCQFADLLVAARAPAVIVAALERHGADVDLPPLACAALGMLSIYADAGSERVADAAVAARAPEALIEVLRSHSGDEVVRMHALRALAGTLLAQSWPDAATWSHTRDALVSHIAAYGCALCGPANEPDMVPLKAAVAALVIPPKYISSDAAATVPPGAAAVLCVALRAATGADAHQVESLFTGSAAQACTRLALEPGAAGAAFRAEACAAGAVELLTTAAVDAARLAGAEVESQEELCFMVLSAVAVLTDRVPAAACRAAACGMHLLLNLCLRAFSFAGALPNSRAMVRAMAPRLNLLVAQHDDAPDSCAVPDCDLRLMSRQRCCLPDCDAGDVRVKRCASCLCAAFCSPLHQRQAWPRHKAVCRARAAVEAAVQALKARGEDAS
jgi:hypothetical protein